MIYAVVILFVIVLLLGWRLMRLADQVEDVCTAAHQYTKDADDLHLLRYHGEHIPYHLLATQGWVCGKLWDTESRINAVISLLGYQWTDDATLPAHLEKVKKERKKS